MLGSAKPGTPQLVSSKVQDISNITPQDYSYSGFSPLTERDGVYESLVFGLGESMQQNNNVNLDRRYLNAGGVDASVWPWCCGPELVQVTPSPADATVGVTKWFELLGKVYACNGRYIKRRDSDANWIQVADFGAGVAVLDAVAFQSNFDGIMRVFIALSSGQVRWTTDGTTYTAMATFTAVALARVGKEFWMADDLNRLRKCDTDADPTNEANYTASIFRAGDKSSAITALMVTAAGTLLVAKTDGLYTFDATGKSIPLFPFLQFADDANNGKYWGQFENSIYTSYGFSLGRIDNDLSWTDVGLEKLTGNRGPVKGRVTAFCGVGSMFAYAAVTDPDTQTGFLCKFGAWAPPNSTQSFNVDVEPIHIDAWHGSVIFPLANRAIQSMFVSSFGAPTNHTRTYVGFSDGSVGWMVNPCVPYPPNCSQYRFSVGDHSLVLPIFHGGFHASIKSFRNIAVTGQLLNATNYVQVDLKDDPQDASWTQVNGNFDSATYELQPIVPMASGVLAQLRVHLVNTVNTASPLVSAVALGHALRPQRLMQVEVDVLVADGLVRRDGVPMRVGRRKLQQCIEHALDSPGSMTVTLPDESTQELSFIDLKVSQSFDEVGRQYRASLHVTAMQQITQEVEI
jgi:hypothetical protein